jgi:DNA helicase-2/ATP-dependent DNA helicase PcrA
MTGAGMTLEELLAELDAAWEPVGFLTRRHEEARHEAARQALTRFWTDQQADPASPAAIEQEFAVSLGRERVRGRYDRVDRDDDGRVTITDYKSSEVRDPATANRRARESLQLSLYALAYEAQHGRLPDELALHFLESGMVGRVEPGRKRLEKAAEAIAEVGDGIRAGRFEAAPSAMRCGFCPFREICPDAAR